MEKFQVFLMGLTFRIDRCESGSGVNRMIAYRSNTITANNNFAPSGYALAA